MSENPEQSEAATFSREEAPVSNPKPTGAPESPSGLNAISQALRSNSAVHTISGVINLVPGAFLSVDPSAMFDGICRTGNGAALSLDYATEGDPQWVALHLSLGDDRLSGEYIAGIVCKSQADSAAAFRACIRTFHDGKFSDTFFKKHIVAYQNASLHVDFIRFDDASEALKLETHKELVIFLPTKTARFRIDDIRMFFT